MRARVWQDVALHQMGHDVYDGEERACTGTGVPRRVTDSPEWGRLLAVLHQLQGSAATPPAGVVLHGVRIDTKFTLTWVLFYQALAKILSVAVQRQHEGQLA